MCYSEKSAAGGRGVVGVSLDEIRLGLGRQFWVWMEGEPEE